MSANRRKCQLVYHNLEHKDTANATSTPLRKQFSEPEIIPSLEFLRGNTEIQSEVANRLKQLEQQNIQPTGKHSLKSGRYRAADTQVNFYVSWPQEYVYVGPNRKTVAYDDLTSEQFTLGYLRIVQRQPADVKASMLDHLTKLLQSSIDFNFNIARGSHAVILQEIERGSFTWRDSDDIERTRLLYTNKVNTTDSVNRTSEVKRVVCSHYNSGKCTQHTDHRKDNLMFRHICTYCYRTVKKAYSHPETSCHRKSKDSNNA